MSKKPQKPAPPAPQHEPEVRKRIPYSTELAEHICELLMDGLSLRDICALPDIPSRYTIFRWLDEHPGFATIHARARRLQADFMDDLILDEAKACTEENVQSTRVRIGAYQWRAGRLEPKKYGDKTVADLNVNQQDGHSPEFFEMVRLLNEVGRQKRMTIEHQPEEEEK